jgi:hypothetical protein
MQEIAGYEQEEIRIKALANALHEGRLSVSAEDTRGGTLCVIVDRADRGQIIWGTADVNWGAAIQDADGEIVSGIQTDCPSDTEDVSAIARVLEETFTGKRGSHTVAAPRPDFGGDPCLSKKCFSNNRLATSESWC